MNEADVVCREAGYPSGAVRILNDTEVNQPFGRGHGQIALDGLTCNGDETSILECKFEKVTNCKRTNGHGRTRQDKWVGVECKESEWSKGGTVDVAQNITCDVSEEWKCGSGECVGLDQLCDGEVSCGDGSDESPERCPEHDVDTRGTTGRPSLPVDFVGVACGSRQSSHQTLFARSAHFQFLHVSFY